MSVGTISARDPYKGWPSATLKSVSDGPAENGTGIPYIYMTDMDITGQDLNVANYFLIVILGSIIADNCTGFKQSRFYLVQLAKLKSKFNLS